MMLRIEGIWQNASGYLWCHIGNKTFNGLAHPDSKSTDEMAEIGLLYDGE